MVSGSDAEEEERSKRLAGPLQGLGRRPQPDTGRVRVDGRHRPGCYTRVAERTGEERRLSSSVSASLPRRLLGPPTYDI